MASKWSISGVDLHLALGGGQGRRASIEHALRDAIRDGRLAPGLRLPPSRALAGDLGVARGTVVEAYAQLAAEGFVVARQGSGTVVARVAAVPAPDPPAPDAPRPRHDLRPGLCDVSAFPRETWVRSVREAMRTAPDAALVGGDPRGQPALRHALARYLGRARGVVADAERIVVCNGLMQGFGLACHALRDAGARTIALEDPCIANYRTVAARSGLSVRPVPVDSDGARVDVAGADPLLVTPAHQFPLGATLAAARRAQLVEQAREHGTWVVEDDYDGEFRYDRQPVGAMQALDPGRTVYAGTASKALAPGLRLGWLVVPEPLLDGVVEAKRLSDRAAPAIDQLALAEMIDNGTFDRHVRRMRLRYRRRRDALLEVVARAAPHARVLGVAAGMHVVLELPDAAAQDAVLRRAAEHDLALAGLREFAHRPGGGRAGVVVGYGAPPAHGYAQALAALERALSRAPSACARAGRASGAAGG